MTQDNASPGPASSGPTSARRCVAIAQASPVFDRLEASLDKAAEWCRQAAAEGADLIVFPETWLAGYPAWLDLASDVALWAHEPTQEVFATMRRNSLVVPSPQSDRLGKLAKELNLVIAIGVNERVDIGPGNRTLFNSFLVFDRTGELVIHHRKLVPTYTEKLVWGPGDAHGLHSADTGAGRIGGLICWEHWMPLARQALHVDGEQIHLALWPTVKDLHQMASRHYAFEGRCFVIAVGSVLKAHELPEAFQDVMDVDPDEWVLRGGSAVFGPDGEYVLEPIFEEETLRICELDLGEIDHQALTLDVSGHYARPELLELKVNRGADRRPSRGPKNQT